MTPVETAIRGVDRSDLLAVQRIENACFADPWPFEAFERFLDEPAFLVAERSSGATAGTPGTSTAGTPGTSTAGTPGTSTDGIPGSATGATGPNAKVVGYIVADSTPNFGRDIGHVKDLAVAPDARGAGVGRALLRTALVRLRSQGAAVVKLEVRMSNAAARSLYADEGFEPLRQVPRYYRDGEDALVLVVDLEEWAAEERAAGE